MTGAIPIQSAIAKLLVSFRYQVKIRKGQAGETAWCYGCICRMHNNRKIKELMFGRMEGKNKRGRPHKEWLDDIIKWGKMLLQKLSQMASDRGSWKNLMKLASNTYGR